MNPTAVVNIDVVQILAWAVTVIGSALLAVSVWTALGIFRRLDGIEKGLATESTQLRELFHGIDKRVLWLESKSQDAPRTPQIGSFGTPP